MSADLLLFLQEKGVTTAKSTELFTSSSSSSQYKIEMDSDEIARSHLSTANATSMFMSMSMSSMSNEDSIFRKLTLYGLEIQAMNNTDSLFYWISRGDLTALQGRIDGLNVHERDPTGATIILKAYMLTHYELGRWLVRKFPELALLAYSDDLPKELAEEYTRDDMPYTGANILHIAILRRDFAEVRWLLDFFKDHCDSIDGGLETLLSANATGKFFDPDGDFYFGGYPMRFAVCTNSVQMFDLVFSYAHAITPSPIFLRDSFGNTALHLCAIHGLQTMFQHICETAEAIISRELQLLYFDNVRADPKREKSYTLSAVVDRAVGIKAGHKLIGSSVMLPPPDQLDKWLVEETRKKMDERLLHTLNASLHSPLTLAASISRDRGPGDRRGSIFKELFAFCRRPLWTYGPISHAVLSLDGVDTGYDLRRFEPPVPSASSGSCKSALHWLSKSEAVQCLQLPEIRTLIETKWSRFGRVAYMLDGVVDAVMLVPVTLILLFVNFSPTVHPKDSMDWFIDFLYAFAIFVFVLCCVQELDALLRIGLYYKRLQGVVRFHALCRAVKVLSFFVFLAFQLYDGSATVQHTHTHAGYDIYGSALQSPQDNRAVKIPLAVCVLTAWVHCHYYMVGFESTGPLLLLLSRICINDLPYFFGFFIYFLLAFGSSIAMVANYGSSDASFGFVRLAETIFVLIQKTVNIPRWSTYMNDITTLDDVAVDLQWVQDMQITLFYGIVSLVLVKVLIAIMSSTYKKYLSFKEADFLLAKCHIMEFLELHRNEYKYLYSNEEVSTPQANDRGSSITTYSMTINETIDTWVDLEPQFQEATLFIIDPQVDFHGGGALAVAGAEEDSMRVADMIRRNKHRIRDIFVSLSSLHPSHIAHATFWKDRRGRRPPGPFTTITYRDVVDEVWRPRDDSPEVLEWCLAYTRALEDKGSAPLTIWPDHCIIGMMGHAVAASINEALQEWALSSKRPVTYVMTGQNCRTEMRSALQAEVEDPRDPATAFNADLFYKLQVAGRVQQPICFPSSIIIS